MRPESTALAEAGKLQSLQVSGSRDSYADHTAEPGTLNPKTRRARGRLPKYRSHADQNGEATDECKRVVLNLTLLLTAPQ